MAFRLFLPIIDTHSIVMFFRDELQRIGVGPAHAQGECPRGGLRRDLVAMDATFGGWRPVGHDDEWAFDAPPVGIVVELAEVRFPQGEQDAGVENERWRIARMGLGLGRI